MKIILCTFLLCITAVSVFGQSVEVNGTLGESVKFPAAVKKDGFLIHGVTIGEVVSSRFIPPLNGNYRDRLQWDSSTGLFSLSGLTKEDIGEYKVQNTDQNINTVFQLNVYTVSVFGKELNRSLGENVKFPAAVKKVGSLMYGTLPIGDVTSGSFRALPAEKYSGRVQWDSSTGFFSLSGLREEDSGEYKVQNEDQIVAVFQLNVYIPVSKPNVSITQNEYPCTTECTAESGTGVTLSWYREGEKKSFVFSRVASAPGLYLPAPVESGTYTCEAKNSVSNEKASITVGAHCTANPIMWILIAVAVLLLLLAIVAYCLRRRICRFLIRCLRPEETKNLTSSHQTEVALNRANLEVGEP